MTESLDLDAIQARCDAATPGPWEVDSESYPQTVYGADGDAYVIAGSQWNGEASVFDSGRDAVFIAQARTDVPALIARVCELEAENAAYEALQLGALDGRVSAACGDPLHPTWIRYPDDDRGCPWCASETLRSQRDEVRRHAELFGLKLAESLDARTPDA